VSGEVSLEGVVEAFDLPAGLWVVGPGVDEHDASAVQGDLEGDATLTAVTAGEYGPVEFLMDVKPLRLS